MPIKPFQDTDLMPFGKHKGHQMQEVPASYLLWLWNNGLSQETATSNVAAYIEENLQALTLEDPDTIID